MFIVLRQILVGFMSHSVTIKAENYTSLFIDDKIPTEAKKKKHFGNGEFLFVLSILSCKKS